jgi:formylglycine-generating enzyme required for sulfatase activity/tRNA A-37 threonylcarbamoyl transferase component Bud32/ribosomal protein L40E
MSTTDNSSPAGLLITVCTEIPSNIALKQKISETPACETWDVFDRAKKKKHVLKRIKTLFCGDAVAVERFKADLFAWEQIRTAGVAIPAVTHFGQDADGIWYIREHAEGRSCADAITQGKQFKEHEAARKFLALADLLGKLHQGRLFHHNLKPANIFSSGLDDTVFVDFDAGRFRSPTLANENYDPTPFGLTDFLAPEQRPGSLEVPDARTDVWSFAALLAFTLTGSNPAGLQPEQIPEAFRPLISSAMSDDPAGRPGSFAHVRTTMEQLVKATRPSAFEQNNNRGSMPPSPSVAAPTPEAVPPGAACPQCHTPIRSLQDRVCPQCGRSYQEPCLNCQSLNPVWVRTCRGCSSDLLALKQKMFATLNAQKQQILKFRESYGHDKTLPLLKYMSTVNHPDFAAFKEWAKSMNMLIQKERRDIKTYVDNIRSQTNAAMDAQKYDKVQQILEQVPRPLLDDPMRQQYVEAGDAITEVDSLIREIRNAISTKQYSQLLSCVQRYLELKANDPEAQNLQLKIEKLTTIVSAKGMKLRRIPGGRFYMGSHDSDEYLRNNEHPQHRVIIPKNLFVSVYPVTQGNFQELMEYNPSVSTENELCPADSVTWFSAVEFCNKMSELESLSPFYELKAVRRRSNGSIEKAEVNVLGGDGYRLLTEAEWEYACRAGGITPWCFGDQVLDVGEYAWYYDNSSMETHPVGERKPNSWGLFDMHGNVMEWCHDWYGDFYYSQCSEEEENPTGPMEGSAKTLRGGAWQFGAEATRCAYRNSSSPDTASSVIGFRVCRNATDEVM